MTFLTSISLFIIGTIAYSVRELITHGKLKWMTKGMGFWGNNSDRRKYKTHSAGYGTIDPPNNFYYRFYKIPHKEKFPGSATFLVLLTDAPHLMQFLFKIFLIGSLVMYKEMVNPWVDGLIYFGIWGIVFTVVYKDLSK